ncbi:MAG: DUF4331 family protein, partial [Bdellovibrionota bacterium]
MKISLVVLLGILTAAPLFASDHIDGPVTMKNRVADLTDLYVFPTPKKPGTLSVILDTYPLVGKAGHFSDKVTYTLRFRRAAIKGTGDHPFFDTTDEQTLVCTFKTPEITSDHVVTCKTSSGAIAENKYDMIADKQEGDDFRLYAGMRSDPFFFNLEFAALAGAKGILLPGYMRLDHDIMKHLNILTMVMEIDVNKLWKENPPSLIAVAADSSTQDSPTSPVRQIDRVGRPEITNVTMAARKGDAEIRDAYNTERSYNVTKSVAATMKERIFRNIDLYDQLDKKKDWKDADRDALASILTDDFLVVDMSKSCDGANFFDIEKALLKHVEYTTCGGRRPNDDIMDTLFTLYIGGLNGKRVSDNVNQPSRPVS